MVAGGCLCCVGELEFGKQIRDILKSLKPTRLLIEPSGAGHAADIVDELAAYETQGVLTLNSVICLVDALDAARILEHREANEWSQIQSADVLLLSKADLAGGTERRAFAEIAASQYPAKAFIGDCTQGVLPIEALQSYLRAPGFSLVRDTETSSSTQEFPVCDLPGTVAGSETHLHQLGLWAVNWTLPRELTFSRVVIEPRINWMLEAYQTGIRRLKGVFRTGPGPSWLIQSHGRGLSAEDSAYRRDSRLEVVFDAKPTEDFLEEWRSLLRDAALAPRR
jgi:G3E family GTPase